MTNNKDYIFGIRAVIEAIESGKEIDRVLIRKDLNGDLAKELIAKLREHHIVAQRVPQERLNRVTMKNHQGVIAFLSAVEYYRIDNLLPTLFEEGRNPFVIVLDSITDTRNFGAIARTADCVGADCIVIPQRGSVTVNADAVKTSAGALLTMPVCREYSITDAVKYLKESGVMVVGASEKSSELYTEPDYNRPVAIVMGAEDKGISPELLRLCDRLVAIPIKGNIQSLNVSVAAGVMMYEVLRSRNEK